MRERYIRKGDHHPIWIVWALNDCMRAYPTLNRKLVRYANLKTNRVDAPEIVAGVWVSVVSDIISGEIDEWWDGIAWRRLNYRLVDHHRHEKCVVWVDAPEGSVDESLEPKVMVSVLVQGLPADERVVVEDKLAGYTVEETAERIGVNERTVRRKWATALDRMRSR